MGSFSLTLSLTETFISMMRKSLIIGLTFSLMNNVTSFVLNNKNYSLIIENL